MTTEITEYSNKAISNILTHVKSLDVIDKKDLTFLQDNKKHLSTILEKSYMWRTDIQKESIVSDAYHPTLHSKFHQAILEQKVQFDQSLYLAKDFELKKLDLEGLLLDLEQLEQSISEDTENENLKYNDIERRKLEVDIQFKEYELQQMKIAMSYRMAEVKGWQKIVNELMVKMKNADMSDNDIWDKNEGEITSIFLQSLSNLQGIKSSTDGAERNNLIALALFSYNKVKEAGRLDELKAKCDTLQLDSLNLIENSILKK